MDGFGSLRGCSSKYSRRILSRKVYGQSRAAIVPAAAMPDVMDTGLAAAQASKGMPHTAEAAGARDRIAGAVAGVLGTPRVSVWALAAQASGALPHLCHRTLPLLQSRPFQMASGTVESSGPGAQWQQAGPACWPL